MDSLELLGKIVSINSVSGNEAALGEFLEAQLRERGFATKRIPISGNRFSVAGERGKDGKPVLLFGHMDTVPVYGNWEGSPFALREEGGRLHGLGVYDMKAGVAAILSATEGKSSRKIKVAFSVDEENISEGGTAIAKSGFFSDAEIAFSTEISTALTPPYGPQEITLGRRGRCVIEIEVPGKSAHGATVEKGISAINEASMLVLELERMNGKLGAHALLPPPSQFVRKIYGESTSLSIPETAVVELDRHLVTPQTPESVLLEVNGFIAQLYKEKKFAPISGKMITARLKERKTPYLAPYVTPKENPHVRKVAAIIERKFGAVHYSYGASVADDNVIAGAGVPVFSIGPLGGGEHSCNEWISKKGYLQLIDVLKEFVGQA